MKVILFVVLAVLTNQATTQRSEFVDYLLQLQYITDPLHDYITSFYAQARASLSEQLTGLNDDSVHEITEGLRTVIAIRDRTEELIGESSTPENEECVNNAISGWANDLENVGNDINQCADQHVAEIYDQTESLHLFIQQNNRLAFDVQNMVLNTFTRLNPMTDVDEITPSVEAEFDEIQREFDNDVRPEIDNRLRDISNLRVLVPNDIHTCVDESIVRFLLVWFFCGSVRSWSLASLNITASNCSIINVSVYYGRAFLCLKHSVDQTLPTLIEASWPENIIGVKTKIFPSDVVYLKRYGKCKGIKQAQSTDIDSNGRLWMIDNGNEICSAKLIVYDLLYFNDEVHFQAFGGLKGKRFAKIIVDPIQSANGDVRVYLSTSEDDYLYVYSLNERKLGKIKFTNNYIQPSKSLSFSEMVLSHKLDMMYISDTTTGNLYSLNLTPLRFLNFSMMDSKKISIRSPLTYIGSLLGPPKALTINPKGIMFYIIPRFSTVVTWDPKTPLTAEWHEVIYQSNGNLSQLLCGQKGSVYVISEKKVKTGRDGREKHAIKIHME
ncbi:CLUMA_CG020969, isoform A [Clunio marinus]|uniref:CLUMA_CG020969, isoform A n=1 Tax=Clunio marinus TaxID=568069 RepID=A0A1J1J8R5_9DIPT|nr:CLUMA_CG020969, isoform A [Clunio marinus]